jgi:hypothetical protein
MQSASGIELREVFGITDVGVAALGYGCSQLESIDLTTCHITDISVLALLEGCDQLILIDLSGCDKITMAVVSALRSRNCDVGTDLDDE